MSAPLFSAERAIEVLGIEWQPFDPPPGMMEDPTLRGYSNGATLAIKPAVDNPRAVLLHEIAHIVLGHTIGGGGKRWVQEVEADVTAWIVQSALGDSEDDDWHKYYIDTWYHASDRLPTIVADNLARAAQTILEAGAL